MPMDGDIQKETFDYFERKAPVLFLVLTKEGVIIRANQYAQTLTGKQLAGDSIQNLILDFTGDFNPVHLFRRDTEEHLLNINTAHGLPQSFFFSFIPVEEHVLAFGRIDAEEIENMRKELLLMNQELNNLTRQLQKANAQLKYLNEEKNRFLGMAAHDLRKPIGLLLNYSEFLIDEASEVLSEEHKGFLNTIFSSCDFMRRLVDDFLDVSAIEAGKFELDLEKAYLPDILASSLELNNLQAQKKGIRLLVESNDDLPELVLDASKIEQVITNLVSNAIEHTKPDSTVTVGLSCDPEHAYFYVRDEGQGIPPEELDRLFKPFEKTSAKKTGGEKSTGLGMVITRKIIEAHKGQIWVDSRVGQGTTIQFKIPAGVKTQ